LIEESREKVNDQLELWRPLRVFTYVGVINAARVFMNYVMIEKILLAY